MIDVTAAGVLLLLAWGTVVGLDLVSVPQGLLSRPLVVGIVAGALLGDIEAGARAGAAFELFALDVLPFGAVRYPDYGPATVAATAVSAGAPWELALGVALALGLVLAVLGGWTIQWLRRANARAIQRRAAALAAGESRALRALQYGGLARDALRSAALTAVGLAAAWAVAAYLRLDRATADPLTVVGLGAAFAAVIGGALRSAGSGARLRWLGAGLAAGAVVAALA